MLILAFDLASVTGWCMGNAGDRVPWSGAFRLRKPRESHGRAGANLIRISENLIDQYGRPDYVVKEERLSLAALRHRNNSPANIEIQIGLHAVVEAFCILHNIEYRDINMDRARKGFIGRSNCGSRDATKLAVVNRCHLLGLMPKSRTDDNQADAICTWWGACAELAFTSPKVLHLFGESPKN